MRKLTLTAMALALTVSAGAAQAGSPKYLPYNWIQGMGDMQLPKVHVHPHAIKVHPHLNIDNGVEFGQFNSGEMKATQGLISKGPKDVTGTAAAIGNTASVDVRGGVLVEGNQKNYGETTARLGALVIGAKDVELTSAAIGNATNVTTTGDVAVDMNQVNLSYDTEAKLVSGIFTPSYRRGHGHGLGDVATTAAAIGNSLSVEFGKKDDALVSSRQLNLADATAFNFTAVSGRFDSAEVTSAAIGNALNITNVTD